MKTKAYLLDDVPVDFMELIKAAKVLDDSFGSDGICCTSEAARILRENGCVVAESEKERT